MSGNKTAVGVVVGFATVTRSPPTTLATHAASKQPPKPLTTRPKPLFSMPPANTALQQSLHIGVLIRPALANRDGRPLSTFVGQPYVGGRFCPVRSVVPTSS